MLSMNEVKELLDRQPTVPLVEAGEILGLSRNTTYNAAARGDIKTIQLGRLKRVPSTWLKAKLGLEAA
jgi:excisionase family DNA binding protein